MGDFFFLITDYYLVIHKKLISKFDISALNKKNQRQLQQYDFEEVLKFKLSALHETFELVEKDVLNSKAYKIFYTENEYWLKPYAVFSYLRDKYGTTHFTKWKSRKESTCITAVVVGIQ